MSEENAAEEKAAEEAAEIKAEQDATDAERFEGKSEDEITEMKAEDTKAEGKVTAEAERKKEEHRESSKLGRRISKMEDMLTKFIEASTPAPQKKKSPLDDMEDGDYISKKDLVQLLKDTNDNDVTEAQEYGKNYTKALKIIGNEVEDEDLHLKVMKLVTEQNSKFNVRSSSDPAAAAQINYYKALNSLGGKSESKPKLKGDKNLPAAGAATKTKKKAEDDIELSAADMDYLTRRGLSIEQGKKLLKKKAFTSDGALM